MGKKNPLRGSRKFSEQFCETLMKKFKTKFANELAKQFANKVAKQIANKVAKQFANKVASRSSTSSHDSQLTNRQTNLLTNWQGTSLPSWQNTPLTNWEKKLRLRNKCMTPCHINVPRSLHKLQFMGAIMNSFFIKLWGCISVCHKIACIERKQYVLS